MDRRTLIAHLDQYLDIGRFEDGSWNGLQVEGADEVERVAYAVDACDESIAGAAQHQCQVLVVHHGLMWGKGLRIVGPDKRKIAALLAHDLSLYAAHLPLDAHAEVGNNVEILRRLGAIDLVPFGRQRAVSVGWRGTLAKPLTTAQLVKKIEKTLDTRCAVYPYGPARVRQVAAISGAGGFGVFEAPDAGVEVLVTGEWDYSKVHFARDHGVTVIAAGHYRTETTGVQCLARHVEDTLGLPGTYLDFPIDL